MKIIDRYDISVGSTAVKLSSNPSKDLQLKTKLNRRPLTARVNT